MIYMSSPGATPTTGSFSVQLGAQGGMAPYTWSVSSGSLPTGLTLNPSTGVISGTPTGKGRAFTIKVTDLAGIVSTKTYTLDYLLQLTPAAQPKLVFSLASLYPLAMTGAATMAFQPDGSVGDPSVVFASGKNTLPFTIPVGSGSGTFSTGANRFQTGTVVGTITITLSLQAGGLDITPSPAPVFQIRIAPLAPVITGMTAVRDGGFLNVTVQGFSETREVQQAFFVLGIVPGET